MTNHDAFIGRIQRAAPELTIDRIEVNQEGMVNDVVVINGDIVFRFPKTAWGQRSMAAEIATHFVHYGERIGGQTVATYPISPELSERARFRAGCLGPEWALIGVRGNDLSMLVAHIGGTRDYAPL